MNNKIIFECNFYDLLIDKILNRLTKFIQYNPDDLHRNIIKKVIEGAISEISNLSIDEIDRSFESLAKIRIYYEPKKGIHLKTSFYDIFIPNLNPESINQIEAEDCYIKAFFAKINENLRDTIELDYLIKNDDIKKLNHMLNEAHKYAIYATIYKITKNLNPNKAELEKFIKSLE
jgi:hypothetical protein